MNAVVRCYETNEVLNGSASTALVRASKRARATGAVLAYYDESDNTWDYVAPSDVDHCRRNLHYTVRTVCVAVTR